jgi:hypothetical protein
MFGHRPSYSHSIQQVTNSTVTLACWEDEAARRQNYWSLEKCVSTDTHRERERERERERDRERERERPLLAHTLDSEHYGDKIHNNNASTSCIYHIYIYIYIYKIYQHVAYITMCQHVACLFFFSLFMLQHVGCNDPILFSLFDFFKRHNYSISDNY